MLHEVHGRLFRYQHIADPLAAVADRLMQDMRVLCLDEFFVTDVADATILARLFGYLWDRGLVLVATSNRWVALSWPCASCPGVGVAEVVSIARQLKDTLSYLHVTVFLSPVNRLHRFLLLLGRLVRDAWRRMMLCGILAYAGILGAAQRRAAAGPVVNARGCRGKAYPVTLCSLYTHAFLPRQGARGPVRGRAAAGPIPAFHRAAEPGDARAQHLLQHRLQAPGAPLAGLPLASLHAPLTRP